MTFGEKLQVLRRKAGLSQDALAEQLEVSRQAVSKWERDETMPETEKVIRIARLFQVSLDELLMDSERVSSAQPQQQATPRPSSAQSQFRRDMRRHGYKLGYIPMAICAIICLFSIIMFLVWPVFGSNFLGSSMDQTAAFPFGHADIIIESDGDLPAEVEDAIRQELAGEYTFSGGLWTDAANQMDSMMRDALQAQAGLFLIGLIPGGLLLSAGLMIVIKGKKIAEQTSNI